MQSHRIYVMVLFFFHAAKWDRIMYGSAIPILAYKMGCFLFCLYPSIMGLDRWMIGISTSAIFMLVYFWKSNQMSISFLQVLITSDIYYLFLPFLQCYNEILTPISSCLSNLFLDFRVFLSRCTVTSIYTFIRRDFSVWLRCLQYVGVQSRIKNFDGYFSTERDQMVPLRLEIVLWHVMSVKKGIKQLTRNVLVDR